MLGDRVVILAHNTALPYRIPFFKAIFEQMGVRLFFTHFEDCRRIYGLNPAELEAQLGGVEYAKSSEKIPIAIDLLWTVLREKPDVVVMGGWNSLVEAVENILVFVITRITATKYAQWNEDWAEGRGTLRRILWMCATRVARGADALFVPGIPHRRFLESLLIPSERIVVLPNATALSVRLDHDYVRRVRKQQGLEAKRVILYVGRLAKRKGVGDLIRAFSALVHSVADVRLLVVGEGPERAHLEKLTESLNLKDRIHFLGFLSPARLAALYKSCDVVVVPSRSSDLYEPWGFVVNEAMESGKPVIASNVVGAALELIEPEVNGLIFQEGNVKALVQAIKRVIEDDTLRSRMGEAGRQRLLATSSYQAMVSQFSKGIEELLSNAGA